MGILLIIGDGVTPEVFTVIAGVKDIKGPILSREFAEFTHQQSASGYRVTLRVTGPVTWS